jgi:hypothetical protein
MRCWYWRYINFNLTKVDAIVKNNAANLSAVVYYETLADAAVAKLTQL